MNLIMSDVEETIMIVDPEGASNGRGVVNVCCPSLASMELHAYMVCWIGGKKKNGNAVRSWGWRHPCSWIFSFRFFL